MGKKDQGFKDLLGEVARLVNKATGEGMESKEFREGLDEINQRMSDQHDCCIARITSVVMGLEFITIPVPGGGEEKGGREKLSLNFRFGSSPEDQEMGKKFGLDRREMNRLLKQARQERDGGKRKENITPANAGVMPQLPAETEEAAESPDPRNISQIINSVREIARALSFNRRRLLIKKIRDESKTLKQFFASITEEQIKNDTVWLQCVQNLINEMQIRSHEVPKGLLKETLLDLEGLFKKASVL